MAVFYSWRHVGLCTVLWVVVFNSSGMFVCGKPASFAQDFRVTWSNYHLKQVDRGTTIQLTLDRNSGSSSFHFSLHMHNIIHSDDHVALLIN